MPRPKDGYKNAAGQVIPGTHDPISRFMDQTALKFWAYKQGKAGLSLFDRSAIDIGSAVHHMAELDLRGRPDQEIEKLAHEMLTTPDQLQKAFISFAAFREWRERFHVRAIAQETPLISEKYQFGGTPDLIALVGNQRAIVDFKTSPKPYPDHLLGLAAHGQLWNENHPDMPLTGGYHLICLPKDGSPPQHYAWYDLSQQFELYKLYLQAYHLDKLCSDAKLLSGGRVVSQAAAGVTLETATRKRPAPKPRVRVKVNSQPMSMGELLRTYGHVGAVA